MGVGMLRVDNISLPQKNLPLFHSTLLAGMSLNLTKLGQVLPGMLACCGQIRDGKKIHSRFTGIT